ncbi:Na+/H+ antiporter subunit G [Thiohalospira sp.]|uniref:Na+/H+ antiporter subunit G n=1 Tax=Thiohalospira sp. TaxID=3080549 RepID=UPI0039809BE9
MLIETLIALLLLLGAGFTLVGSIGLARLPDLFMRLHGPTKATTLGVGGTLLASVMHFSAAGEGVSLHELLVALFLFITAPISAYLLARTALHLGAPGRAEPPRRPYHDGREE